MSEHKLTQIDSQETLRYSFDEATRSHRMSVVGGDISVSADLSKTNELLQELVNKSNEPSTSQMMPISHPVIEYKTIEIPKIINETIVQEIEKQIIVKEFVPIEIQKVIIQEVIKEVERPVYVTKTEIQTVEVPSQASFPNWLKLCMLAQAASLVGILLVILFKH